MATADYTITRDQIRNELDRQSRELLKIPGPEFLRRYRQGDLDRASATVAHLAVLARLLKD